MKPRMVRGSTDVCRFIPTSSEGNPVLNEKDAIIMTPDELEALRLVDYEGLLQEEAAVRMRVSRGTVWRCLDSARRKVAAMLAEGRELIITFSEARSPQDIPKPLQEAARG